MATYLVVRDLAKGKKIIPQGSKTDLAWLDEAGVQRLIVVGAVRSMASPPLAALGGWKARAARLDQVGIVTIADFLAAEDGEIAAANGVKVSTVKRWRKEIEDWGGEVEGGERRR